MRKNKFLHKQCTMASDNLLVEEIKSDAIGPLSLPVCHLGRYAGHTRCAAAARRMVAPPTGRRRHHGHTAVVRAHLTAQTRRVRAACGARQPVLGAAPEQPVDTVWLARLRYITHAFHVIAARCTPHTFALPYGRRFGRWRLLPCPTFDTICVSVVRREVASLAQVHLRVGIDTR